MIFAESVGRMQRGVPYRKHRPQVPIIGNAKAWWIFAYTCVKEDISRKNNEWDWHYIKAHRDLCKEYGELYKTKLQNKKVIPKKNNSF